MIGSLVIMGAILALLVFATPGATGVEVSVSEIVGNPEKFEDRFILVTGSLIGESVDWNARETTLRFTIADMEQPNVYMDVVHYNVRPDNFDDEVIVILDGKYDLENNEFIGDRIRTRCPSKYEEEKQEHPGDYEKQY